LNRDSNENKSKEKIRLNPAPKKNFRKLDSRGKVAINAIMMKRLRAKKLALKRGKEIFIKMDST